MNRRTTFSMKHNKLPYLIVALQILVISILYAQIHIKNKKILGISVSQVKSDSINKVVTDDLHYFYEPKPIKGEEARADWLPYVAKYNINSDTLNERFEYEIDKKKGIFRIITLGDSFTYGSYINTEENWTELLEDYLNSHFLCEDASKYEVINLGIWGYDFAYETERYIRRGKKYNPDLLITLIVDFGRVTEHIQQNQGKKAISLKQKIEAREEGDYYPELPINSHELSIEYRTQYQFKSLNKLFSIYKGPYLMVDLEKSRDYQKQIDRFVQEHKNITLERTQLNFKNKNPEYYLPDGHPNTEGHKKIMDEILKFLVKNKLIPCGEV